MKKYFVVLACFTIAFISIAHAAHAKAYYVSPQGDNNKGNGSAQAPFKTINRAFKAKLQPGDEVVVKPGVYNESMWIEKHLSGAPGRYITLRSETPRGAKIRSTQRHGIMLLASYFKIDGFDSDGGIAGKGVHHVEITNNVVHDSPGPGIYFYGSEFLLVSGNVTSGNAFDAVSSGISIHLPQNVSGDTKTKGFRVIVRNNISYNNLTKTAGHTDGNGIIFDDWLMRGWIVRTGKYKPGFTPYRYPGLIENNLVYNNGGAGIMVYAADNITVRNNTSYHNATDPLAKGQWRGELKNMSASNNIWVNNIAVADPSVEYAAALLNVSHGDWGTNRNVAWANNVTYNGTAGAASFLANGDNIRATGNGNKFGVDPQFLQAPRNFRLRMTSPALDAGTLKYGSSAVSLGGSRRVVKTIDIGAYEKPYAAYSK